LRGLLWACLFGAPRQRFTLAARSWIATQVVHSQFVTCCPRTRFECHFDSKPGQLLRKFLRRHGSTLSSGAVVDCAPFILPVAGYGCALSLEMVIRDFPLLWPRDEIGSSSRPVQRLAHGPAAARGARSAASIEAIAGTS